MRRTTLAVLVLMLAALPAGLLLAQSQDPLISSARRFSQQGNHDTAIAMLRSGLASRPDDEALKGALLDVLVLKQRELVDAASALGREIATLRPLGSRSAIAGCGDVPARTPVRVGSQILTPSRVNWVPPIYPPIAQDAQVSGIVILEVTIDCAGNVVNPRVLRGQPLLNEAALESVRQWQYAPTLLNGVPVPVIMTVTVTFKVQ